MSALMAASWRRAPREALCAEREPLEVLERIEGESGPTPSPCNISRARPRQAAISSIGERFMTYDIAPERDQLLCVAQSIDAAHSEEPTADFSVCMPVGLRQDGVWLLLDIWRQRVDYPVCAGRLWRSSACGELTG
jgi:hypothetical protein